MSINSKKGFVGVDMILAIIAVIVFSVLIVALTNNSLIEVLKINKKALATIYLTEMLENIAILEYEDVTEEKIKAMSEELIPEELDELGYRIKIQINEYENNEENEKKNIFKKVKVTISYGISNKNYEYSMERLKVKE